MDAEHIAICTTTLYPEWFEGEANLEELLKSKDRACAESKIRGDLALQTMEAALRNKYKLIVIDSSGGAFEGELRRRNIPFTTSTGGMSEKRREAFTQALGDENIEALVWTEPEKVDLIRSVPSIIAPIEDESAAIVVPSRNETYNNYPKYQTSSEIKANKQFNDKLHRAKLLAEDTNLDMFIGPRVFSARPKFRETIANILNRKYVLDSKKAQHGNTDPERYSDAIYFPVVAALDQHLPVTSVPIDFRYPDSQRTLEEHTPFIESAGGYREKRKSQYTGILAELVYYLRSIGKLGNEGTESTKSHL